MQYRKRPVVVEAMQFIPPNPETDEPGNRLELKEWGAPVMRSEGWNDGDHTLRLAVSKGDSLCVVNPGDWIIKEPVGEGFYPCTAEDFDATYALDLGDDDEAPFGDVVDHEKDGLRSEIERQGADIERLTAALNTAQDEVETLNARLDTAATLAGSNGLDGIPHERVPLLVEEEHHFKDGKPAGGDTVGTGFAITWQNGPLVDPANGVRLPQSGAFVEAVIQAAIGRIESYQGSQFACVENADALDHLYAALARLNDRTRSREEQGVEGTHEVHTS